MSANTLEGRLTNECTGKLRGVTIEDKMKETRRRWFGGVTKEAYKCNNE